MEKVLWSLQYLNYGKEGAGTAYLNGKLVSELSMTPGQFRKFKKMTRTQQLFALAFMIDNLDSQAAKFHDWYDASQK